MSKKDEALKLALETFQSMNHEDSIFAGEYDDEIAALREALAEQPAQQQEPVACPDGKQCKHGAWCTETYCQEHCEFRAPPASKPWVGLMEQEREKLRWQAIEEDAGYTQLIKATEAKLREKNA